MTELIAADLSLVSNGKPLLRHASFRLGRGECVALVGPNGAGKTTLLRAALGLIAPTGGSATLNGADVGSLSPSVRARALAYLPQQRPLAWPSRVRDIVALGRFSHGVGLGRLGSNDARAVSHALTRCDLDALADRRADTLSGGELARVHCARAFCAETPFLIADEPTAALDPLQQLKVMGLIETYVARGGGALVVIHDVQLAARFAHRLIWMKAGAILADGPPQDTLTPDRMAEVFGVRARIEDGRVDVLGAAE